MRESERFSRPVVGSWVYEQQQLGFNYRITDLQAAIGLSQLLRLDEIVAERNHSFNTTEMCWLTCRCGY